MDVDLLIGDLANCAICGRPGGALVLIDGVIRHACARHIGLLEHLLLLPAPHPQLSTNHA